jgi:hypothetical protein
MASALVNQFLIDYYNSFNATSQSVNRQTCAACYADTAQLKVNGELMNGRASIDSFFMRAEIDEKHKTITDTQIVDSEEDRALILNTGTRSNSLNPNHPGQPFHESMDVKLVSGALVIRGHIEAP